MIAFEPEPRNIACLRDNIALNKIANLSLIPKAVFNECDVSTFYIEKTVDTSRNSFEYRDNSENLEVERVTIDSVFESEMKNLPPISYLKIDVEGFESEVIDGASKTISGQGVETGCNSGRWQNIHLTEATQSTFNYTERGVRFTLDGKFTDIDRLLFDYFATVPESILNTVISFPNAKHRPDRLPKRVNLL